MNTATGLTFASFLPPKMIESMLQHEALRMGGAGALDAAAMKRFEHAMSETRRRGLARVAGTPIPGVNALAASIFEANGNIVLAMTTMGPTGIFDPAWDGEIAAALRSCADTVSARLGYMPSAIATAQKTSTKLTNRNEQRRFDRLPARTVHRGEARHATACTSSIPLSDRLNQFLSRCHAEPSPHETRPSSCLTGSRLREATARLG